jgi:hypothetical protein
MSRTVSTAFKQAVNAQESGEAELVLLTITHAAISPPIRVVNNTVDIVSNGNTFVAFPFDITLPEDSDAALPGMRLKISNIDRRIIEALRTITSPATVTLDVILGSAPNTLEATFAGFTLRNVEGDVFWVEGQLLLEDLLNEPFLAFAYDPNLAPGLF